MGKRRKPEPEPAELVAVWGDPLAVEPAPSPWRTPPTEWWSDWKRRYEQATQPDPDTYTPAAVDALLAEKAQADAAILLDGPEERKPRHLTGLFAWGSHWVLLTVREHQGQVEPVRVEVRSYPGADGELAELRQVETLRALRLPPLVAAIRNQYMVRLIGTPLTVHARTPDPEDARRRAAEAQRLVGPVRATVFRGPGGRKRLSAEDFRRVADTYSRDTSGRPTQAVADAERVSYSTAARWVGRARKLGLLPPTSPGVARGQSTDELARQREGGAP